ncbi:MAG: PCRF domain-containing protein, partial [Alphaproteobacteria bacterium]|nr:PCRF domain-containing protein [Alphaproteobacteria bacterium]
MKVEIEARVQQIRENLLLLKRHLNLVEAIRTLQSLDEQANDPHLWDNPEAAQKVLKEREALFQKIETIRQIDNQLINHIEMLDLAQAEGDLDIETETERHIQELAQNCIRLQLETLLSGEADANNCFMEINAGAGGTEAQDWAQMLCRMYSRWADRKAYKIEVIDENPGEEAGIKSVTLKIVGHQAYGWLKAEAGVHRLVRISPFDSNARRHTSFASVWVYPEVDDAIDIAIEDKDLRVDTFRSSGAGGQHVNTT